VWIESRFWSGAMRLRRTRSGVTLIELVVLLGMIAFLFSFIVPAIFRLRMAAGRSRGMNNLQHIVLAAHNYHDAVGKFPPILGPGTEGVHGTIFYHMLPMLEHQPLHKKGNVWTVNTVDELLPFLLDPRDKSAPPGNKFEDWLATSNYAANWLVFAK